MIILGCEMGVPPVLGNTKKKTSFTKLSFFKSRIFVAPSWFFASCVMIFNRIHQLTIDAEQISPDVYTHMCVYN